jgi:uncharacterized protein (TIGR03437 family)
MIAASGTIDISLNVVSAPASLPLVVTSTSPPAFLSVNFSSLTFSYVTGAKAPDPKSLTVTSTGGPISFTAQASVVGPPWLSVQPAAGTTPQNLTVTANPAGLSAGSYNGFVDITASTSTAAAPLAVPVKLIITDPSRLIVPRAIGFQFASGDRTPQTKTVAIGTRDGQPATVVVGATTYPLNNPAYNVPNWLSAVAPSSTAPAVLTVTANPAGLGDGAFLGGITVQLVSSVAPGNAANFDALPHAVSGETQTIDVFAYVGAGPFQLTASCLYIGPDSPPPGPPAELNGVGPLCNSYTAGSTSTTGTLTIGVAGGQRQFIADLKPGAPWLTGSVAGQTVPVYQAPHDPVGPLPTPQPVSFTVDPNQLPKPGPNPTFLRILDAANSSNPESSSIALITASGGGTTIDPVSDSADFAYQIGGPIPTSKSVEVYSTPAGLMFTTQPDSSWLSASPGGTAGNGTQVTLSVNPQGLNSGSYPGKVLIIPAVAVSNIPKPILVSLTVTAPLSSMNASPSSMSFSALPGGPAPATQTLTVNSTGSPLTVTHTVNSDRGWLSVTPTGGQTTTVIFTVSAQPATLGPGTYTGSIRLDSPQAANTPLIIAVQLTVAQAPVITSVVNGGGFVDQTQTAQNTWTTIFGQNLGPDTRSWQRSDFGNCDPSAPLVNCNLPVSLDGVSVNVNGKPAYIEYINSTQVNVLTPADNSTGPVPIEVVRNGVHSNQMSITLNKYSPALFLWPKGYAVATHLDNSYAAPSNLFPGSIPARPGETITLYGAGFGQTTPPFPPGKIVPGMATTDPVTVLLNGTPVDVSYAGLAPNYAGLYQLNIKIPDQMPDGDATIVAQIGGVQTENGIFLTVKR